MPYSKQNWVANVTPVTAVAMNHVEDGISVIDLGKVPVVLLNGIVAPSGLPFALPFTLSAAIANGLILVAGTTYPSSTGPLKVGIGVDGVFGGQQLKGYVDVVNRRPMVPACIPVTGLAAGAHNLNFRNDQNALCDGGDCFTAVLFGF